MSGEVYGPFLSDDPADWIDQALDPYRVLEPEPAPKPYVPEPTPRCPRCAGPMAERSGPRGAFWGCRQFPNCRGIVDAAEWAKQLANPKLPGT